MTVSFQISNTRSEVQADTVSTKTQLNVRPLNFTKIRQYSVSNTPLTLPYTDAQDRKIQLWKTEKYGMIGAVLHRTGQIDIIPQFKIRSLVGCGLSGNALMERFESDSIKRWNFVYKFNTHEILVLPKLIAAGRLLWNAENPDIGGNSSYSCISGIRLRNQLKCLESFQSEHETVVNLPDGRIRYYCKEKPSDPPKDDKKEAGPTRGAKMVCEYNPRTGSVMTWMECYARATGEVNRTHGKKIDGLDCDLEHNPPTAKDLIKREANFPSVAKELLEAEMKKLGLMQLYEATLARRQFEENLQKTGLTKSYNATHPDAPVPKGGGDSNEIGGVGSRVAEIEGLFDTAESLFEKVHAFFIPMPEVEKLPFTEQEVGQILYELAKGIYVHDTVPFFSLHFNQEANLYPVIHPAYENTLVGQVFSMLDYQMKGYLNGGIFEEDFVKRWSKNPVPLDEVNAFRHMINLKSYTEEHLTGGDSVYCSVRVILKKVEKGFLENLSTNTSNLFEKTHKIENPIFSDYTKFTNSFRIIAKQNKIQKSGHLFVLDGDFDVEYTISPDPEYKNALEEHLKVHGEYPRAYCFLIASYDVMKEKIHDHMVKLPFCQKYFKMLNLINFFSYYFTTLKKHNKIPLLPRTVLRPAGCPSLYPALPLLRSDDIKFYIYEVIYSLRQKYRNLLEAYLTDPQNQENLILFQPAINEIFFEQIQRHASIPLRRELNTNQEKHKNLGKKLGVKEIILDLFNQYREATPNWWVPENQKLNVFLNNLPDSFLRSMNAIVFPDCIPLTILSTEQTGTEIEHGKKIVGGCGMNLGSLAVQKTPLSTEVLNHMTAIGQESGYLAFFQHDQSTLPNGAIYSLAFDDMPVGLGDDPREIAALLSDMIQPCSDNPPLNTLISMMRRNQQALFLEEIEKHNCANDKDDTGKFLIHHAAINKETFFIEELIRRGYSLEAKDDKDYLPIHYAAMSGSIAHLKKLLENQPSSLNARSNQGATPLIVAIQHGNVEMVEFLCMMNADTDIRLNDGYTTLHCAVHTGNRSIIKNILTRSRDDINAVTNEGITPLMIACRWEEPLAKDLIDLGADPKVKAKNGKSALDIAVQRNDFSLCTLLFPHSELSYITIETAIKKGSLEITQVLCKHPDYFLLKNSIGDTPLLIALRHANIPVALHLLAIDDKQDQLSTSNHLKESPIMFAAFGGFHEILEIILKAESQIVSPKDLFSMLLKGGYQGEDSFLENFFNQITFAPDELQELLLVAAECGNYLAISKLLLPKGANLDHLEGKNGWKIDHYLAKHDALFLFKQRWNKSKLHEKDRDEKTLAYIAAENGSWRVLSFLLKFLKEERQSLEGHYLDKHLFYAVMKTRDMTGIKLFLEESQDPTIVKRPLDAQGTYASHLAAHMQSLEVISLLNAKKADLEPADLKGKTPLFYAVLCKNLKVVTFLQSKKVQIDSASLYVAAKQGNKQFLELLLPSAKKQEIEKALLQSIAKHDFTAFSTLSSYNISFDYQTTEGSPLHLACAEGQASMVEVILSQHPFIDKASGKYVLHIACIGGNDTIVKLLLNHGYDKNQYNESGKTPVQLAQENGHIAALAAMGEATNYTSHLEKLKHVLDTSDFEPLLNSLNQWLINSYFTVKGMRGTPLHHILRSGENCPELATVVNAFFSDARFDPTLKDENGNSYVHLMIKRELDLPRRIDLDLKTSNALGQTPLHLAARGENPLGLKYLIGRLNQTEMDPMDEEGRTPLMYAVLSNNPAQMKLLIKARANVAHKDLKQLTPLLHACIKKNYPIVKKLIKYGADINQKGSLEEISPLVSSLKHKNEEISLFLLYNGASLKKDNLFTFAAAKAGKNSILRLLAAKGKSLMSTDSEGFQPLHYAAIKGQTKTLNLFDSLGISLESPVSQTSSLENVPTPQSATPLHLAAAQGNVETVKWLLNHHADPEKLIAGKGNILSCALSNTQSKGKELLSLFKEYLLFTDLKYFFPAILAAISQDFVEPLKLLYGYGLQPNTELIMGANGLHLACIHGSLRCTEFFLTQGTNWDTPVQTGETPLELAAVNKSVEQFRYLVRQMPVELDQQNQKGETLLHLAARAGNLAHVAFLLDEGADFDIQDAQGQTPLFIAAVSNAKEVVELLILCGADLNLKTIFSSQDPLEIAEAAIKQSITKLKRLQANATPLGTPLHVAAKTDNRLAVQLLVRHMNINLQDKLGRTALHEAVLSGKLHNVRTLISGKANLHLKDYMGKTPLDLAKEMNISSIINLLERCL